MECPPEKTHNQHGTKVEHTNGGAAGRAFEGPDSSPGSSQDEAASVDGQASATGASTQNSLENRCTGQRSRSDRA